MNRSSHNALSVAPFTFIIVCVNVMLYALTSIKSKDYFSINSQVLLDMGGSMRERLWDDEWIRLIAPNFLHANLIHIGMNMMALMSLGPVTEMYFGSANFGTIYIISGVAGFCVSQLCGGYLSIGASCALFGLSGAIIAVRVLQRPVLKYAWRNSDLRRNVMFVILFIVAGFTGMFGPMDNWGHIGGLLSGLLLGALFEVWRVQKRLSGLRILSVALPLVLLICAARWTVFSPYYHVHKAVVATEENHDAQEAAREFAQARQWGAFWHKQPRVELVIAAYESGLWNLELARSEGYRFIEYATTALQQR